MNSDLTVGRRARRRIALRLLPFLAGMYVIAYIDRANVSFANLRMSADLGFSDRAYGLGVGMFYLGYVIFEVPGAIIVERWSARKWLARIMLTWGLVTIFTAFVHTAREFYTARFLVGLAEASFIPGVIVYLTHWFRLSDRAKALAFFCAASPAGSVVSSLMAGWLLQIHWRGIAGWRWIFIVEGTLPIILGVIAIFYLTDWPRQAGWLPEDERNWISSELEAETRAKKKVGNYTMWQSLHDWRVWLLILAYFSALAGWTAGTYFLPTFLKRISGLPNSRVALLAMLPGLLSIAAMLLNGWHSDKTGERRWHTAIPLLCGGVAYALLPPAGSNFSLVMVLFILGGGIMFSFLPVFWSMPTMVFSETAAAVCFGLINAVGHIGGFVGPYAVGYLNDRTGSLVAAFVFIAACYLFAGAIVPLVKIRTPILATAGLRVSPSSALLLVKELTMKHQISRRHFTRLVISAAILGFNPDARSWVTEANNAARPFDRVPKLDGSLLLDEESRRAIAIDSGNMFHRVPAAVLRPRSVDDIVAMVRYANQHKLKVAIRGNGHSRYGQTQAEAGVVIDSRSLNAVRVRMPQSADAQPGAFWSAVADTTLPQGLTPRLFPGTCMALLTVGGTLNAGGIGNMTHHYGALVDNVTDLDVVTGDGRLVTCSPEHESELFDMVLAGQGQCGVIVRAGLPLIPAPSHVMFHILTYTDLDAYLTDQLRLASEGRFDGQRGEIVRDKSGTWSFVIEIAKFFNPPNETNIRALEADLPSASTAAPMRMTYHDYLFHYEVGNAATAAGGIAAAPVERPSPVITMWIPASATRTYLENILSLSPAASALAVRGVEQFGCYPLNTRRFTRPLFKVPSEEQVFALWLFRSVKPGDEAALSALLASNRDLLTKMTAVGGKRYAPYSMVISSAEWQAHYGPEVWRRFVAAKAKYDPNRVLSPHPAIFEET